MDVGSYDKRLARHQQLLNFKLHDLKPLKISSEILQVFTILGLSLAFGAFLQGAGLSIFIPALFGVFITATWCSFVNGKIDTLERHRVKTQRVRARLENHANIMHDLAVARATFFALNTVAASRRKSRAKKTKVALFENPTIKNKHSNLPATGLKMQNAMNRSHKSKSVRRMKQIEASSLLDKIKPRSHDFGSGLPV